MKGRLQQNPVPRTPRGATINQRDNVGFAKPVVGPVCENCGIRPPTKFNGRWICDDVGCDPTVRRMKK